MNLWCAWVVLAVAASAPLGSAREHLDEFTQDLKSATGAFEQIVVDKSGRRSGAARGTFALKAPGWFRWEEAWPSPVLTLSTPKESLEAPTSTSGSTGFLLHLLEPGALDRDFTMYQTENRDGLVWLHMTPRAPTPEIIAIDLGFDASTLRRLNATNRDGRIVELRFSTWKRNPELPASVFQPTPESSP